MIYTIDTVPFVSPFTLENVWEVFPVLVGDMVAQFSPVENYGRSGTRPAFGFHHGHPLECNLEDRPVVYLWNITSTEDFQVNSAMRRSFEATLGIRRNCSEEHKTHFREMWGILKTRFGEFANDYRYTTTLNGNTYDNVGIATLHVSGVRTLGDSEIQAPAPYNQCGTTWLTTILQFQIEYKK